MKKVAFQILFILSSAITFAQSKDLHFKYGKEKQQNLDLYLPVKVDAKTQVVIMLHGGAWMLGGNEYTIKHARDLRDLGFIVANVDYRYVNNQNHYKELLSDIDSAFDYVSKQSAIYGYAKKDYHIVGLSAGAHLALLYGYTSNRNIKSISSLCAPSRLDQEVMFQFAKKWNFLKNIELLADAEYSVSGQPDKAFTIISPYSHIKNIPTLLIHGTQDDLVPYQQSAELYTKLQENKVISKLVPMEGKGHDVGLNQPDSEKKVLQEIVNWITTYQ